MKKYTFGAAQARNCKSVMLSKSAIIFLAAAPILLTGCAQLDTYARADRLALGPTAYADGSINNRVNVKEQFAGGASDAIAAANDQRTVFYKQMTVRSRFNTGAGLGMIAITANMVYRGIMGTPSSRLLGLESATLGGLYAADTWLDPKAAQDIYSSGFQDLTCSLLRSRPLLMTQTDFDEFERKIQKLEMTINAVDAKVSALQTGWDLGEEDLRKKQELYLKDPHAHGAVAITSFNVIDADNLDREIRKSVAALSQARKLLVNAQLLHYNVENSGYKIREDAEQIVAKISKQLGNSAPDIAALKGLATDPSKGLSALTAITVAPPDSPSAVLADRGEVSATQKKNVTKLSPPGQQEDALYEKRVVLRNALAVEVSGLYSDARDVNDVVASAQNTYHATRHAQSCEPANSIPLLEISPATVDQPVAPGQTLSFHVSGGTLNKVVSLTGMIDAKALTTSASGGVLNPVVTIPAGTEGKIAIVVTDTGTPSQEVSVTIDVEAPPPAQAPSFSTVGGDKSIKISFPTPTQKSGTLKGYTVTLSTGASDPDITLTFGGISEKINATGGGKLISGTIASAANGNTVISIEGLKDGKSYSVGLVASFTGAADVSFAKESVTPAVAKAVAMVPPKRMAKK